MFASRLFALLALAVSATPIFGAEQWLKINSSHFELFTTASEKKGREAILYFEQVRELFRKISQPKKGHTTPVRIVAFQSDKQYKPYRLNEISEAYYAGGPDRDYIVMQSIAPENYPVALHEFFHLVVRHSGLTLPIWLNEGLAEIYSTLKPAGKGTQIGDLLPGRVQELRREKWLDLATLLSVGEGSPYYNERNQAGIFYSESWALAHMLYFSNDYWEKFSNFLMAVRPGASQEAAFEKAYGKSLAEVSSDLAQYLQGTRFNGAVFHVKLEKSAEDPEVRPATALESGLALAELLAITRKKEEARAAYANLARENPKSAEVELGWARLEWMNGGRDETRRHYGRAIELGITDGTVYFNYAMLLRETGAAHAQIMDLLRKAVELKPDLEEAHYDLGFYAMDAKRYSEAVINLRQVKKLDRARAVPYFRALAYAYYQLGKLEDAKASAESALKYSTEPADIEQAKRLLAYVTQAPAPAAASPATDGERPRILIRRTP